MLAELRERDATGEIAAIYDESVGNISTLRQRAPRRGPHPRDIISQYQTPAAPGADGTAIVLAFVFGYSLTLRPLLAAGLSLGPAMRLALAADTVSIAVMEVVEIDLVR